jgi:hypothetical protein
MGNSPKREKGRPLDSAFPFAIQAARSREKDVSACVRLTLARLTPAVVGKPLVCKAAFEKAVFEGVGERLLAACAPANAYPAPCECEVRLLK